MSTFNPATFRTASIADEISAKMFAGHVITSEETRKLPRIAKHGKLLSSNVRLCGYADKVGCFSVIVLGDMVEVGFMPEATPNKLTKDDVENAIFEQIPNHKGWGFVAMAKLKDML